MVPSAIGATVWEFFILVKKDFFLAGRFSKKHGANGATGANSAFSANFYGATECQINLVRTIG